MNKFDNNVAPRLLPLIGLDVVQHFDALKVVRQHVGGVLGVAELDSLVAELLGLFDNADFIFVQAQYVQVGLHGLKLVRQRVNDHHVGLVCPRVCVPLDARVLQHVAIAQIFLYITK